MPAEAGILSPIARGSLSSRARSSATAPATPEWMSVASSITDTCVSGPVCPYGSPESRLSASSADWASDKSEGFGSMSSSSTPIVKRRSDARFQPTHDGQSAGP
jgi:hypothetical protein